MNRITYVIDNKLERHTLFLLCHLRYYSFAISGICVCTVYTKRIQHVVITMVFSHNLTFTHIILIIFVSYVSICGYIANVCAREKICVHAMGVVRLSVRGNGILFMI